MSWLFVMNIYIFSKISLLDIQIVNNYQEAQDFKKKAHTNLHLIKKKEAI